MARKLKVFTSTKFTLEDAIMEYEEQELPNPISILKENMYYKFIYAQKDKARQNTLAKEPLLDDDFKKIVEEYVEKYISLFTLKYVSDKHTKKLNIAYGLPSIPGDIFIENENGNTLSTEMSRLRKKLSASIPINEEYLNDIFLNNGYKLTIDKENLVSPKYSLEKQNYYFLEFKKIN